MNEEYTMKEYCWEAELAGRKRKIICVRNHNKYNIFVDEDFHSSVYRESGRQMSTFGMEKPVVIDGETCFLVVWNEKPDFVVNGKLLSQNTDYEKAVQDRKRSMCNFWDLVFLIGCFLLAFVLIKWITGGQVLNSINSSASVFSASLCMMIAAPLRKRKWKNWK